MLSLNGTPILQFILSSCLPSFFKGKKKKRKGCSASAASALGGGSCPSVPYKAPHLGARSQSQHMELWNSCRNRIEGRVHSGFTAAQWCNHAALQPPSRVPFHFYSNFTSAIFTSATQHAALNDRWWCELTEELMMKLIESHNIIVAPCTYTLLHQCCCATWALTTYDLITRAFVCLNRFLAVAHLK